MFEDFDLGVDSWIIAVGVVIFIILIWYLSRKPTAVGPPENQMTPTQLDAEVDKLIDEIHTAQE
jgi:hypothetical protein